MIAQERKSVDSDDAGGDQEKSPVLTAQNDGRGKTNSTQHALLSTSMADNTLFTAVATSNKSTDDNTNTHRYREGDKHDDMYELAGEKISRSSTDDDLQGGRLPSATGVTVTTSSSHSEGESSLLAAAVKEEQDEATLLLPRLSCTTMNGSVPAAGDARTTRTTQVREQGDWSVAADKSLASTNSSSSTQKVAHLREKEALRSSMSSKQPAHDAELEQDGKQQHRGKLQSQGIKSEQTTQLPVEETNHPVSEPIQSSSASQYSKVNQENEQNSGQMIRSDTQKQPQQDPVIAHEHSEKVHSQQQQQPPLPKVQQRQKTSRQKGRFFVQPQVPQQQQQQQQMNHRSLPVSQQPPPLMPSKAAAEQPIFTTSLQLQLPRIVSRHQSLPIHQLQSATTPPPFAPPPPSPHNNHNGQSPPFPPTPDTIMAVAPPAHTQIGVISNSPLVSLPDANGQIVTKKKGRFKFLEQAPARVSGSAVEGAETGERQQHEWSSSTSAAPCNSASGMSGTNLEGTVAAPLINKKGRFVVTSVQAPAALTTSLPLVPVEQPTLQPPVPTRPDLAHQRRDGRASVIATAPSGQPVYAAAPPKDGTGAGAITMLQPPFQSGPPPGAIVVLPQPLPTSHRLSPVHMMASSAPPDTGSPSTYHQQPLLPTSEESGPSNGTSSSIATKHNKQPRAASTSRSTSSSTSGLAGQQGFGKMFYFLDQMRLEVTDADRKIKSFQTDMKFMVSVY